MKTSSNQIGHHTGQCARSLDWVGRLLLLVLLICGSTMALAQVNTGDITGSVTDPTGAIVPKATVTIENLATHEKRTQQSNDAGSYTFTFLQPGHYSVSVKASGFKGYAVPDLAIQGGDHARADAPMQVGEQSQIVEVTGQTPLLQGR